MFSIFRFNFLIRWWVSRSFRVDILFFVELLHRFQLRTPFKCWIQCNCMLQTLNFYFFNNLCTLCFQNKKYLSTTMFDFFEIANYCNNSIFETFKELITLANDLITRKIKEKKSKNLLKKLFKTKNNKIIWIYRNISILIVMQCFTINTNIQITNANTNV